MYRAYAINKNGIRNEIKAESIVIAISQDKEFEIVLNQKGNLSDGVLIITSADEDTMIKAHSHPVFNIRPGASNVIHLNIDMIENR